MMMSKIAHRFAVVGRDDEMTCLRLPILVVERQL